MATKMATRQSQLRQQMESLREENQRLDKLVQQQKAGVSPAEKVRTLQAEGSQSGFKSLRVCVVLSH